MRVLFYPTPQGALTQLWAGTSPEAAGLNGEVIPLPSSPLIANEIHAVCCSFSSHGGGSANLVAMTRSLGKSFGLGLKSRCRAYDRFYLSYLLYPPVVTYCFRTGPLEKHKYPLPDVMSSFPHASFQQLLPLSPWPVTVPNRVPNRAWN